MRVAVAFPHFACRRPLGGGIMHGMKRWHIRTLVILLLGAAGMVALAFRPALVPDTVQWESEMPLGIALRDDCQENRADTEVEYRWSFKRSPSRTAFWHANAQDAFALLQGEPEWVLRFKAHDGVLVLDGELPQMKLDSLPGEVSAHFHVFQNGSSMLRLPSGKVHFQRHFMLICELVVTPCLWGERAHSIAAQQMVADFYGAAIDLADPELPYAATDGMRRVNVVSSVPSGLPERFCGNTCERELTRFLYQVAAIDRKGAADMLVPLLEARGKELADSFAEGDKPWPECWGDAAGTVRLNARKIIPLLQTFKEQHAYGSAKLVDFVNGPVFQRIFGETLVDIKLQQPEQPKEAPKEADGEQKSPTPGGTGDFS